MENYIDRNPIFDYEENKTTINPIVADILGVTKNSNTLNKYIIKHTSLDVELANTIYDVSETLKETIKEVKKIYKPLELLVADIFWCLYKLKPLAYGKEVIRKSSYLNYETLKKITNELSYLYFVQSTRINYYMSICVTDTLIKEIIDLLQEMKNNIKMQNINEIFDIEEETDKLEEELIQIMADELADNLTDEQRKALAKAKKAKQISIEEARKKANDLYENIDQKELKELGNKITNKAINSFKKITKEIKEVSDTIEDWGLEGGEGIRYSINEKADAIERIKNSNKLKKIGENIGRFRETAITDYVSKTFGKNKIQSIISDGKDIHKVIPSEKILLGNDLTKNYFFRKILQNETLSYKMANQYKKNRGPMVVCIDTSGSMGGNREIWSKSVAIGLLEIARYQHRNYAAIIFESSVRDTIVIPWDELSPDKIVDVAEKFYSGGTNFDRPLQSAYDLLKTSQFNNGDIVFITDGDCSVAHSFMIKFKQLKEQKLFSVIGIKIGSASAETMKDFCDQVYEIDEVTDPSDCDSEIVHNIFNAIE